MQSKISLKWFLFAAGIAGVAFSAIIIFFLTFVPGSDSHSKPAFFAGSESLQNPISNKPAGIAASLEQASFGLPIRLKIPEIKIDAVIEPVGITFNGAMDVPKGPDNVAWLNIGPRPGESGSAVIAGHYGKKNGKASVFDNLYKLRQGDKLYTEDEKGAINVFIVRGSRSYDPGADARDVFGSDDGKSHLNLITCEGVWNKDSKSYSKRLVVFADRE